MKIFVINLDRDAERLAWMDQQLSARGLAYERFPALSAETAPERIRARFHSQAKDILLPGEIGCFASHLAIAERLLESDAPHCLVLEDDVEILCTADELRAMAAQSDGFDLLKLNDWPKTPTLGRARIGAYQVVRYLQVPRGTGSFFLSRRGAERLLSRARELATVADYFFREEAYLSLDIAGVTPPPIPQDRFGASSLDPAKRRGKSRSKRYFYAPGERTRGLRRALATIKTLGAADLARLLRARLAMSAAGVKRDEQMRYVLPTKSIVHAPPRLFFVAHNRNHVRIFERPAEILRARGVEVAFATIEGHADQPHAQKAIEALGYSSMDVDALVGTAGPRDIVVLGNDWGPKRLRPAIDKLKRRGVGLVGVIEGARFSFPKQYVQVDEVLCWGPSGRELLERPVTVVGSPMIEKARRLERRPPDKPHVLINYKFAYGAEDDGFAWGRAAIRAAERVDPDYVLSTHPASEGVPADAHRSHAPFHELLAKATLLITRSSTVIYEALAAGVSVLYYPLPDEKPAEFDDPRGAFATARSADELLALAEAHAADSRFDSVKAAAFLDWHVSIDPARPAAERLAEALAEALKARAEVSR